ncbi:hypothetical protein IKG20_01835 [Candidatus Saccharibacteria bacterium]|nr:hypothetical protein [Candidatus Saccharibacteria bacterium]
MIGQNDFSKPNSNTSMVPNAIVSSGSEAPKPTQPPSVNVPVPPAPTATPPLKRSNLKPILFAILGIVIGAGLSIGAYFLFFAPKTESNNGLDFEVSSEVINGSTTEEIVEIYDKNISSASSGGDLFQAKLDKAGFYIMEEDYPKALEALNNIDTSSLTEPDLYRLYSHYVTVYDALGDSKNAKKNQDLAQEIAEKLDSESTEESE